MTKIKIRLARIMNIYLLLIFLVIINIITCEKCEGGCVLKPENWADKHLDYIDSFKKNDTILIFTESTLICDKSIQELIRSFSKDSYYNPNIIVNTIIAYWNVNINSACTTKTSFTALKLLTDEIQNSKTDCSNFGELEKLLTNSPTLKQLGKTLYLFNSASNYGPNLCQI